MNYITTSNPLPSIPPRPTVYTPIPHHQQTNHTSKDMPSKRTKALKAARTRVCTQTTLQPSSPTHLKPTTSYTLPPIPHYAGVITLSAPKSKTKKQPVATEKTHPERKTFDWAEIFDVDTMEKELDGMRKAGVLNIYLEVEKRQRKEVAKSKKVGRKV
jgi:hypothetical protein